MSDVEKTTAAHKIHQEAADEQSTETNQSYDYLNADSKSTCSHCGSTSIFKTPRPVHMTCLTCGTVQDIPILEQSNGVSTTDKNGNRDYISQSYITPNTALLGSVVGYSADHGQLNQLNKYQYDKNVTYRTYKIFRHVCSQIAEINQNQMYDIWEEFLRIYAKQKDEITNSVLTVAAVMMSYVRRNSIAIKYNKIVRVFKENGRRVGANNLRREIRERKLEYSISRASDYLQKFASMIVTDSVVKERFESKIYEFGLQNYEMYLVRISDKMLDSEYVRKDGSAPHTLAVTFLYLADRVIARRYDTRQVLTQRIISNACDSAEFTIRDHIYKKYGDYFKDNLDDYLDFFKEMN